MRIRLFEIVAGLFRAKPKWPQHDRNWMPEGTPAGWVYGEPEQFIGAPSYEDGLGRETLASETTPLLTRVLMHEAGYRAPRKRPPRFCIGCGEQYGYRERFCRPCRGRQANLRAWIASDMASGFTRESGA